VLKITVVGAGYVGLANAVLLAQKNTVTLFDIDEHKIALVNDRKSPIADAEIETYLAHRKLNLTATTDPSSVYKAATYIIIAAPTNYDPNKNYFDTTIVETLIAEALQQNPLATIVIKSTVPVGFTLRLRSNHPKASIIFSPEFLREGKALYDNLYPSRIVIGDKSKRAHEFATLLEEAAIKKDIPVIFAGATEAEAIKLFANTYLAMRVAYFNELDTYAEIKQLNSREIIKGISTDPRVGDYYNNPSFGYGGYCLPKDSKQLRANFDGVPSTLIRSIITSNDTRIKHIADSILSRNPKVVGVYRLAMKAGSDNFRESAIKHVIDHLHEAGVKVILYEPALKGIKHEIADVIENFEHFVEQSDVIIANRLSEELEAFSEKVYTRDLFARD
jgi:UDPglucose 6-dehydrogenase